MMHDKTRKNELRKDYIKQNVAITYLEDNVVQNKTS